jgi:hypothetical protein
MKFSDITGTGWIIFILSILTIVGLIYNFIIGLQLLMITVILNYLFDNFKIAGV